MDHLGQTAGIPPPAAWLEGVVGNRMDDDLAARAIILIPEQVDAASMCLVGDDDDFLAAATLQRRTDHIQFLIRIDDGRLQNMNGFRWNTDAPQDPGIDVIFSGIVDAEFCQGINMHTRVREPNLFGVAVVIELRGFERAVGSVAAQYGDRSRGLQRIFLYQPLSDA